MNTALADVETLANAGRGIPNGPAVRASLILLCTAWETYVEDVIREAARAIVESPDLTPEGLPDPLRQRITNRVKSKNPWLLAGDGWKTYTLQCVEEQVGGQALNTPDYNNVNKLLEQILDLPKALEQCTWQGMPSDRVTTYLDDVIQIRGEAVHRGTTPGDLNITGVLDWHGWITRLSDRLDSLITEHLWSQHRLTLGDNT
ncbi:HEPN domain-containing protein [Streptomyces sp. NPDC032198]|uniref:HEPN domain-containing protein n=1 Tax=Streptomyces sp. NPDC032198 TaxID=3155127 RepID=UPI0034015AB5